MFGDEWVVGKRKNRGVGFRKELKEVECIWVWFISAIGFYYVLFMFGVTVVKNGHVAWGVEKRSESVLAAPPQLLAIRVRESANQQKYRRSLDRKILIPCLVSNGDGVTTRTSKSWPNHRTFGQHIFGFEGCACEQIRGYLSALERYSMDPHSVEGSAPLTIHISELWGIKAVESDDRVSTFLCCDMPLTQSSHYEMRPNATDHSPTERTPHGYCQQVFRIIVNPEGKSSKSVQ